MKIKAFAHPGERIITSDGTVRVVAFTDARGQVWVYGSNGLPVPAQLRGNAYGGEHDMELGLAA